MTSLKPTVVLTQEQIDGYHQNGFLAIEALTTPAEVESLQSIYDSLFAARVGREVGDQFDLGGADQEGQEAALPQILGPSKYAPALRQGQLFVNAEAIARQLLGPEAKFGGDHAILKPAEIGAATPWHQDEAYWDPSMEYNSLSIWIPLQDATVESGCMQFIPGSHRSEVQPHHTINHDPRVHGLEIDAADTSGAVACPIPAGGATVHHNRTLHYAGPNLTGGPRRAYILGFSLPARPRSETRDFYWNAQKRTPREERARAARENAAKP
ncbi:MAG TPA: phytanoyl-CoA dioxygenase family protein [Armatimonadota bacterium]|nr:phytanoyl-CoA dioxygenase family protein [Armatimonadota bacterium]